MSILFAIAPLYLTSWQGAVYYGALLVISFAFSSDAAFRCLDPANKKKNSVGNVFLTLCSLGMLVVALLQYGPIANDMRQEKLRLDQSLAE